MRFFRHQYRWTHLIGMVIVATATLAATPAHAASTAGFYDDTSSALTCDKGWVHKKPSDGYNLPNAYNGTIGYTGVDNLSCTFTFTGSRVTLWYFADSLGGSGQVYIDGALQQTSSGDNKISFYAPPNETRWRLAQTWDMTAGTHTITFRTPADGVNKYTYIDGFEVDLPVDNDKSWYDNTNSLWRYTSEWVQTTTSIGTMDGGGTVAIARRSGSAATISIYYSYTATMWFVGGPDRGIVSIRVDGIDRMYYGNSLPEVDLYRPTYQLIEVGMDLDNANSHNHYHTITVTPTQRRNPASTDTKVGIDMVLDT